MPLGKQDGLQGGPSVAGEALVRQARLLQQGGIGVAHAGSMHGGGQHEELRDDSAHTGSCLRVAPMAAGSGRIDRVGGIRSEDAAGGVLGR